MIESRLDRSGRRMRQRSQVPITTMAAAAPEAMVQGRSRRAAEPATILEGRCRPSKSQSSPAARVITNMWTTVWTAQTWLARGSVDSAKPSRRSRQEERRQGAALRERLAPLAAVVAEAPLLPTDVHDVEGLRRLGEIAAQEGKLVAVILHQERLPCIL